MKLSSKYSSLLFMVGDIIFALSSITLSFLLRFEWKIPPQHIHHLLVAITSFPLIKIASLGIMGMYRASWTYFGLRDLSRFILANFLSLFMESNVVLFLYHTKPFYGFPRSTLVIDFVLFMGLSGFLRISKRMFKESVLPARFKKGKRAIIIGAGEAGESLVRSILRDQTSPYVPIAFLDDDRSKQGMFINGVKVIGTLNEIGSAIEKTSAQAVLIAIPSLSHEKIRKIYETAKKYKINDVKIVPQPYKTVDAGISVKSLDEIKIEDLLGRDEIKVEVEKIKDLLREKTVLITGAAGSIGSEIAKQVLLFNPKKLIIMDIDETRIFDLERKLKELSQEVGVETQIIAIIADIKDYPKIEAILREYRPDIVFHAAAYKHVPLMEEFPEEAVKVNVFGTYNVARASVKSGVKKFIMISTDKAVNPTSVMGATKRIAEYIVKSFNDGTKFISVRFGNVLGSRGSVIPIFLEQLKKGGPLTVTHPEMKRYFMTIPEAVSLVLQAATLGKGKEVMVLDMGEPVSIMKLAEDIIRLHGLEPHKDIKIEITGMRPGEKLFEELLTAEEGTEKTIHSKIFVAKEKNHPTKQKIERCLKQLKEALNSGNKDTIKKTIFEVLKELMNNRT